MGSPFTVDLENPESIGTALRHAGELAESAEARLNEARKEQARAQAVEAEALAEIDRWRAMCLTLENAAQIMGIVPKPDGTAPEQEGEPEPNTHSKARALEVVKLINGPTNPAEVAEHMTRFDRKTVTWALWTLADEGAIQKIGRGRYAPLDWEPGKPSQNYILAGKLGFPVPPRADLPSTSEKP